MRNSFETPVIFKLIPYFIGFVFFLIISVWIFYGFLAYKAVSVAQAQDYDKGIKPVIERVWCGEPGCLGK